MKFPCDMCPQIPGFLSENVLASHKFSQHRIQDPERLVKCHVCDKMLQNVHILNAHRKSIHIVDSHYFDKVIPESQLRFHCVTCDLKFLTENILNYHLRNHEKKPTFYCFFCPENFDESNKVTEKSWS